MTWTSREDVQELKQLNVQGNRLASGAGFPSEALQAHMRLERGLKGRDLKLKLVQSQACQIQKLCGAILRVSEPSMRQRLCLLSWEPQYTIHQIVINSDGSIDIGDDGSGSTHNRQRIVNEGCEASIMQPRRVGPAIVCSLLLVLGMVGCGGSGSGQPPGESPTIVIPGERSNTVTIAGIVDDGTSTSPIPHAICRFMADDGTSHDITTDANGAFSFTVAPGVQGYIRCSPPALPNLVLSTFVSTKGRTEGENIANEHVTPVTTMIAEIIAAEAPADPQARKMALLRMLLPATIRRLRCWLTGQRSYTMPC